MDIEIPKSDDFQNIILTKHELSLLENIKLDCIKITDENRFEASHLDNLRLASIHSLDSGKGEGFEFVQLEWRGLNYLSYLDGKKAEEKNRRKHDWWIAIVSAILGALLSEPLRSFISEVVSLFTEH